MVLRTNVSVNQLSIYGAVADVCDELACRDSGCSEGTGKLVAQNNAETMVMPTEFSRTNKTHRTNEIVQGNLLHDYERTFANIPDHLRLIILCSNAGIAKTVAKGQRHFLLSMSVFHGMFRFFILRFNEEDTTFSSFGFLYCCFSSFSCIRKCFHISGHNLSGFEVVCFLVSLFLDHAHPSGGFSLRKVNLVKPVHASDQSRSPSTFQQSSTLFLQHHI